MFTSEPEDLAKLQGAWRLEELPRPGGRDHAYGFPNTHWLIVGHRIVVTNREVQQPICFDMRLSVDNELSPLGISLSGAHGGRGHFEVDDDILVLNFGTSGVTPPRFASDCGLYFSFIRDHEYVLPEIPERSTEDIHDEVVGTLVCQNEIRQERVGSCTLADDSQCEITLCDELAPNEILLPILHQLVHWLQQGLPEVKDACGEAVQDWMDEDDAYESWTRSQFADTIEVHSIEMDEYRCYLWAATSVPIDHCLRVFLKFDGDQIRVDGVSIEG